MSFSPKLNLRNSLCQAILACVAVSFAVLPLQCIGANSKAYILTQQHRDLGPITVTATQNAITIDFEKYKCKLVSHAPDWKVYFFRPSEKIVWVSDIEDSNQIIRGQFTYLSQNVAKKNVEKDIPVKFDSIDQMIKTKKADVIKNGELQGFHYRTLSSERINYRANTTIECLTDLPVAPQCAAIIGQLSGLGSVDQMPISVKKTRRHDTPTYAETHEKQREISYRLDEIARPHFDLRSGTQTLLSTTKIQTTQVPTTIFSSPENYKVVVAATHVLYSSAFKDEHAYGVIFGK